MRPIRSVPRDHEPAASVVVAPEEPIPEGVDLELVKDVLEVGPEELKRARHLHTA